MLAFALVAQVATTSLEDARFAAWIAYHNCVSENAELFSKQRGEPAAAIADAAIRICFNRRAEFVQRLTVEQQAINPSFTTQDGEALARQRLGDLAAHTAAMIITRRAADDIEQGRKP